MASKGQTGLPPLFTKPAHKDHPEQRGVITFTRARLVLLLCLAACIPLAVEHVFM